jgi:hypothetical protein
MKVKWTIEVELIDLLDLNGTLALERNIDQLGFHTACLLFNDG